MASLSAKFLLVTVLVHLSLIPLAVHAEEEEYDAEAELEARGFKEFLKKYFLNCKQISAFVEDSCNKLLSKMKK